MRRATPVVLALLTVTSGLTVAGSVLAHTETPDASSENKYTITDQGTLTAYGGPVILPHQVSRNDPTGTSHTVNDQTRDVWVPTAGTALDTQPTGGEHRHVGTAVSYAFHLQDDNNWIDVDVDYDNEEIESCIFTTGVGHTTDFDLYLYGPEGEIVWKDEGCDSGHAGTPGLVLDPGEYEAWVVARQGAASYETTVTIED